ncbi:hypothetical protein Acr_13g0013630 [Actinidia rufa]|uniref:Bifunctional inhibitor/plant lipid transfer protein/seed storage helical domain-containing protein n=1 Tax=Actinidia rufa TaxID=165716 RepID=A0A7J0FMZ8_9ERIC|nr:hypothetical protein Acr_13g0013630 [Actinidia rufa]
MRSQTLASFAAAAAVFLCAAAVGSGAAEDLTKECSSAFEKVGTCLSYATGKAAMPSKECCGSVTEIKNSEPVCLCYIIQQTHNGSNQIKSMGIQEGKLLQLPTTCQLTNASGPLTTTTGGDNIGSKHSPNLAGLVAVTVAVLLCSFPTEIVSAFYI